MNATEGNATSAKEEETRADDGDLLSDTAYTILGSYLGTVGSLAIIGNICLISFFASTSNRKNTMYLLILNIAVADLVESILGYPLAVYSNFKGRWMFGSLGCDLYAFTCFTATLSNMMTYVAISIYRFCAICYRNEAGVFITRQSSVRGIICIIWVYSLLWASIPFTGWGSYGQEKFKTSCSVAWTEESEDGKSFVVSLFVFILFVPVSAMGFMYLKVVKAIRAKVSVEPEQGNSSQSGLNIKDGRHGVQFVQDIDVKVIRIVSITMAGYLIAWLPYGSMSMVSAAGVDIPLELTPIPTFFAKTQPLFNPVIFLISHDGFRQSVKRRLLCRY